MNTTFETTDGKTRRTYAVTVGPIMSDLGDRQVTSITLIDEQPIDTQEAK